jgi:anti-anti-sigma regulatory factor
MTGVPFVDTSIINYLNRTIQAARLKGARTIITGISDWWPKPSWIWA